MVHALFLIVSLEIRRYSGLKRMKWRWLAAL